MLPFLKPKPVAGVIVQKRKPDGSHEVESSSDNPNAALEACAEDIIRAIDQKDSRALASALRSAFVCCANESSPEGESA